MTVLSPKYNLVFRTVHSLVANFVMPVWTKPALEKNLRFRHNDLTQWLLLTCKSRSMNG